MATDVKAHITGTVWKIEKQKGEAVAEGETVIILESMKMEMPVEAPCAGTVAEIKIKEGQAVNEDQILAIIAEE
jgi:acetyl-CoA carboxylase biotin carboxyl carrier protein